MTRHQKAILRNAIFTAKPIIREYATFIIGTAIAFFLAYEITALSYILT